MIIVPAVYRTPVSLALHLEAFSATDGHPLTDQIVTNTPETITTEGDFEELLDLLACNEVDFLPCLFLIRYSEPHISDTIDFNRLNERPPLPGVAIFTFAGGGTPWVIVSDGIHDLVGYNFDLSGNKFFEGFRAHDPARKAESGPRFCLMGIASLAPTTAPRSDALPAPDRMVSSSRT